ncbi:MAG: class I SAM-dependent methyltransferase [Thermotaleaceae bacterium]
MKKIGASFVVFLLVEYELVKGEENMVEQAAALLQDEKEKKAADFWNFRAKKYAQDAQERKDRKQNVVEFFMEYSMVTEQSRVLDIGCGPGHQAIALGRYCKEVVALDISEEMLGIARENAIKEGLKNIKFEKNSWNKIQLEDYGWKKAFDLVYASMTPGVHDFDTLKKMIDASRKHCFLSGFVRRKDSILDELLKVLKIDRDFPPREEKIYCSFNTLWQMGYYPELRYMDRAWTTKMSLEEAVPFYIKRIELLYSLTPKDKKLIHEFIQSKGQDGRIEERTQAKIAWMNWQVSAEEEGGPR